MASTTPTSAPPVTVPDFATLRQSARDNVKTHSSVFNHMKDHELAASTRNKGTTPGKFLAQSVREHTRKDPRITTADGRRQEQDMGAFHTLTGLLQNRGPEVGAIAVQGLASLFDKSAPMAPWAGPATSIGPHNTVAMMLALLWPDIAGPLADPAFLAASDALDPTAVPQLVAAAAAMLPADTTDLASQLLLWASRTIAWAATLDPTSLWDAGTMGTVSMLANVATMLTGPDADAFMSDPALLPSLLSLAQRDNAATAAAITAATSNIGAGGALSDETLLAVDRAGTLGSQTVAALTGAARAADRRRAADAGTAGGAGLRDPAGAGTVPIAGAGTAAAGAPAPGGTSAPGGTPGIGGSSAPGGTPAAGGTPIAPPASTGDAAAAAWAWYKAKGGGTSGAAGTPASSPTAGSAATTGAPTSGAPAGAPVDPAAAPGLRH